MCSLSPPPITAPDIRTSLSSRFSMASNSSIHSDSSSRSDFSRISVVPPTGAPEDLHLPDDHVQMLKEMYLRIMVYTGDAPASLIPNETYKEKSQNLHLQKSLRLVLDKLPPERFKAALKSMIRNENLDNILLRYLRKKKFDVHKSVNLFVHFLSWRDGSGVDELLRTGDEQCIKECDYDLMLQHRICKAHLHQGRDKTGKPLAIVRTQRHLASTQSDAAMSKFIVKLFEEKRLLLNDLNESCAVIFDLTNFTLANLDYSAIKTINACYRYYPGVLGHVYIYNAPRLFEAIWNAMKLWLDAGLVARVTFTRNLSRYITPENLPPDLNGSRTFEHRYIPFIPGENDRMKDTPTKKNLEKKREQHFDFLWELTILWVKAREGSDLDYELAKQRSFAFENFRKVYFELDPYIRGRTVHDRNGTFGYFVPELCQPELELLVRSDMRKSGINLCVSDSHHPEDVPSTGNTITTTLVPVV